MIKNKTESVIYFPQIKKIFNFLDMGKKSCLSDIFLFFGGKMKWDVFKINFFPIADWQ